MLRHPKKNEIEDWMDSKTLEFAQEGSTGTRLSVDNLIDKYIYYNIHEIFFAKFLIILYEWFSRVEIKQPNFQRRETVE